MGTAAQGIPINAGSSYCCGNAFWAMLFMRFLVLSTKEHFLESRNLGGPAQELSARLLGARGKQSVVWAMDAVQSCVRLFWRSRKTVKECMFLWKGLAMRKWRWALLLPIVCWGCGRHDSQSLTPARAAAVDESMRVFMRAVAHDVTQEGPVAWRRYFAESASFFMVAEGRLAFPNGAAAKAGIEELTLNIKQIELRWGDDLRVDALATDLAVVATPYHEIRVDTAARRVEETGFFTGLAENRDGRWQFRNAHWSVAVPPPVVP
jgi:hypothetical protein